MRTSRTRPTKLATAPILSLPEMSRTSRPRSKSSFCTETFIRCPSSTGDRREERYLVARLDVRPGLRHRLVQRRAHRPGGREDLRPGPAAGAQVLAQRADGADRGRRVDLLAAAAQLLAQRGEEQDPDFHR